ncbi:MAG: hypothetical protein L0Y67_07025, partial [Gammaproteobacteria bacterium]|nr:hypothetical protein [Gammaproteobacteria bacterium]
MGSLHGVLARGELRTPHGSIDSALDFSPPDCNGNLIIDRSTGRPFYVDFQAFELANEVQLFSEIAAREKNTLHFGGTRFFRGGGNYLYQSIPGLTVGKRDVTHRWREFEAMFKVARLSLAGRTIYDIGCNTGLMLYNALSSGALWGFGWDTAQVIDGSRRILLALGATRFTLIPGAIGLETNFACAIPDHLMEPRHGVLFYLAISDHIGFPNGIASLPWQYMLYEGHSGQSIAGESVRLVSVPWLKDA